jgi:hypothetical protein
MSYGSFWYGRSTGFPGFLYKKNNGVGARKSTKMGAGGNTTCNGYTYLYNKYKPGQGGVGASSTSNRRAKNRLATVCDGQKCFPCYTTLGQYSNYTHNPNGYVPCPYYPPKCPEKIMSGGIFTTNAQLEELRGVTTITGNLILNGFIGQPDFSVFDCLTTIEGIFEIINNPSLTNISGFSALNSVGQNFGIGTNTSLTTISGFLALNSVGGFFEIINNTLLTNISGFSALKTVGQDFEISNNLALTNISGFLAITGIGSNTTIGPDNVSLNVCLNTYNAILAATQGTFSPSMPSFTTNPC